MCCFASNVRSTIAREAASRPSRLLPVSRQVYRHVYGHVHAQVYGNMCSHLLDIDGPASKRLRLQSVSRFVSKNVSRHVSRHV